MFNGRVLEPVTIDDMREVKKFCDEINEQTKSLMKLMKPELIQKLLTNNEFRCYFLQKVNLR